MRPLDHLQWVLERRQKGRPSQLKLRGETWLPYAYCRTKAGLETALSRLRCEGVYLDPKLIAHLPALYPEEAYRLAHADDGLGRPLAAE